MYSDIVRMSNSCATSLTSAGLAIKPFVKALLGNADCGADFKPVELTGFQQLIDASTANAEDGLEFLYCVAALVSDDSVARIDIIHVSHSFSNYLE